jgi:hypothetical protein
MAEEIDEGISKLVPELSFPEVLEVENERLKLFRSFVALLGKKVGNSVVTHDGGYVCGIGGIGEYW